MRVAVTGAGGRLGRALVAALEKAPSSGPLGPLRWSRPDYDLDDPGAALRMVQRDTPQVVVHAAAWTDVDGCAREPERAMRRNAIAVAELAGACAAAGSDLVLVSTNEVFDGRRTDGRGYAADDRPAPGNAYGASKLAGEAAAQAAFLAPAGGADAGANAKGHGGPRLAIVRTAWLFGPPGNDFPAKVLGAADRARAAREPLRVVVDEFGSPTLAADLAAAIVELMADGSFSGVHHVVNAGSVSRADWARAVLAAAAFEIDVVDVPLGSWRRPSTVPAWAVLTPTPLPSGRVLRPWEAAFADYVPQLLRGRAAARR